MEDEQYKRMTETPVERLICQLALPTITSMLVTAIYNSADAYFVGKLGKSASGAVGVVFSLMTIIQAVGFTVGMGAGSNISRLLGARKNDEANVIASSAFCIAVVFGLLLTVICLPLSGRLMLLLGATDTILPYAVSYARYILLAAPLMTASFVMNNVLRSEGHATFSMIGISTGGILNMILDPIFIFRFNMGIAGAAAATAVSQCVSFLILLSSFVSKRSTIRLSVKNISFKLSVYARIIKNGLPSFTRQGLASIATVMLNKNAGICGGDAAISAMTIVGKVFMMIFSSCLGFGQGYQPVVGYNYGAKRHDRVRRAFFFALKVGTVILTCFAVAMFIFAEEVVSAFIKDGEVIGIGIRALRAQCLSMPVLTLGVICNMTFQTIGKSWTATFLSSARQGIFFLPAIVVLPMILGLDGVIITQPVADIMTFLCCIPFAVSFIHKLPRENCRIL